MIRILVFTVLVLVTGPLSQAHAEPYLKLPDAAQQGALVIGEIAPDSNVSVDGRNVRVSPTGLFLVAVGRDDKTPKSIVSTDPQGRSTTASLDIVHRDYDIQRIDGLPKKTVTPDPETAERIGREIGQIREVRKHDSAEASFVEGFVWPLTGTITGVYGSQRILNGNPRRPHFGVDIAAPEGTPIGAMGPGTIRLAHEDMVLTGKTVMIDHGHGLMSVYTHMSDIAVVEGDDVEAGQTIGAVGQTGRATGPHLHWGVTLFATQLDPMLVAGPMPEG